MIKLFCFTSILLMTCFLSAQDKHDKTEYKSISLNYKDEPIVKYKLSNQK